MKGVTAFSIALPYAMTSEFAFMNKSKIPFVRLVFVGLVILGVVVHIQSLDGLHGRIFKLIEGAETDYAKGYTNEAFRRIKVGQTQDEVIEIVGEPFNYERVKLRSRSRWMYSRSPNSRHYLHRGIRFEDGHVIEVEHHFYFD